MEGGCVPQMKRQIEDRKPVKNQDCSWSVWLHFRTAVFVSVCAYVCE